jgi:hypothetical protein
MRFTPKVRKAIYAAVAGVVPLLVIAGLLTDEQSQAILTSTAAFLTFLATMMAAQNTQANNPQGEFEDEDFTQIETPEIPGK